MISSNCHRFRYLAFAALLLVTATLIAACTSDADAFLDDLPVIPTAGPPTFAPPSPTPSPTLESDPASADCENGARYLSDVTIPDGSPMASGQSVVKTWRLRNNGTCDWNSQYELVQVSGNLLLANGPVPLPDVAAGDEADISVTVQLSFETQLGSQQRATFQIHDPQGNFFGVKPFVLVVATTEADRNKAIVSGKVWLDRCTAGSPPESGECVTNESGGPVANGTLDSGEAGIAGITVRASSGVCPGSVVDFRTAKTNDNGIYTLIGVEPGSACVSIDALNPANESILVPGGWTSPNTRDAVASVTITLAESERRDRVNFGWDFQFD